MTTSYTLGSDIVHLNVGGTRYVIYVLLYYICIFNDLIKIKYYLLQVFYVSTNFDVDT